MFICSINPNILKVTQSPVHNCWYVKRTAESLHDFLLLAIKTCCGLLVTSAAIRLRGMLWTFIEMNDTPSRYTVSSYYILSLNTVFRLRQPPNTNHDCEYNYKTLQNRSALSHLVYTACIVKTACQQQQQLQSYVSVFTGCVLSLYCCVAIWQCNHCNYTRKTEQNSPQDANTHKTQVKCDVDFGLLMSGTTACLPCKNQHGQQKLAKKTRKKA